MFGQIGKELLLSSQNIKPTKLQSLRFVFEDSKTANFRKIYLIFMSMIDRNFNSNS